MKYSDIIDAIRSRTQDAEKRTDFADRQFGTTLLAPPLSAQALSDAERRLGFALHPLHRRVLEEVGNGGFGPGAGLLGLPGGYTDEEGRSALDLRDELAASPASAGLPHGVLPLCDYGAGRWFCVDELTNEGTILVADENGLTDTGIGLGEWLSDWASGVSLSEKMFTFVEETAINPFTRQPIIYRSPSRAKGTPRV